MKKLLVPVALIVALIPLPSLAQDVSGVWKIDGNVADNPVAATCTFKQSETHISGSCKMQQSETPLEVTGQVGDKQVNWKYDILYEGKTYTLNYTGSLDSSAAAIKGTILVDPSDSDGDFTATKQ
jgi:hypothetical protein